MFICIVLFFGVVALILVLTSRLRSQRGERIQFVAFVLPAVALIAVGLLYPAIKTIYWSFKDNALTEFVGLDNYHTVFTDDQQLRVLANTAAWVVLVPIASTFIGLVYAVLVDRSRFEKFAKALIFLPMAISLVGASIIWKFVYDYKDKTNEQIGLANQILKSLGFDTYQFLLNEPWNTLFLIVIMIWVQAGFAMTLLSASIKAIPEDIV
jgi:alpha-glucoside transport system permease protein